jgi:hypothetical protein
MCGSLAEDALIQQLEWINLAGAGADTDDAVA